MKNVIFSAILLAGISLTSCAKSYTCECKIEHTQSAPGFSETKKFEESTSFKGKEDEAKSACSDMEYSESYTDGGGYKQEISQKCKLR